MNRTKTLNDAQRQAISWGDGAMLVLAGPGSGKTEVLTSRLLTLLKASERETFRLLALTFTNRAGDEMRNRLIAEAGPDILNRVYVGTFHSFCADILRSHGNYLSIRSDFHIYGSSSDKKEILLSAGKRVAEKLRGYFPDTKALSLIDRARTLFLTPEEAAAKFTNPEEGHAFREIYAAYRNELGTLNALDFEALLMEAYQLFKTYPALAEHYRATYKYWSIDEFQDTNDAQFKLIQQLCGNECINLFVVADDDQIIYQWNGASYRRVEEFIERYKPTIVQLPVNYRCPEPIVGIANSLIQNNFYRRPNKSPLQAGKKGSGIAAVVRKEYETDQDEANGIADYVASEVSLGTQSVAVLARARYLLDAVKDSLSSRGIEAVIVQRLDEFQSLQFIWIHACLQLANERTDAKALERVVGSFNELANIDIETAQVIAEAQASEGDFLRAWLRKVHAVQLPDELKAILRALDELLHAGGQYRAFVANVIEQWDKRATVDRQTFSAYEDDRAAWEEISREIRLALVGRETISLFLQELQMRSKQASPKHGVVSLMTIHAAKGNEFDNVWLMGLAEDVLPSYQSIKKGDRSPELEEERRNCFVAITRAGETLVLSNAKRYKNWEKEPSRFLAEMGFPH